MLASRRSVFQPGTAFEEHWAIRDCLGAVQDGSAKRQETRRKDYGGVSDPVKTPQMSPPESNLCEMCPRPPLGTPPFRDVTRATRLQG